MLRKNRYKWLKFGLILICCGNFSILIARDNAEYYVKATFLLKIIDFVTWPEDKAGIDSPDIKNVCVFGKNPFDNYLQQIATLARKSISITNTKDLSALSKCDILFISRSEKKRIQTIIRALNNKAILTISDNDDFVYEMGMIELVTRTNQLRMKINLQAVTETGVRLSSNLIDLATLVKGKYNRSKGQDR